MVCLWPRTDSRLIPLFTPPPGSAIPPPTDTISSRHCLLPRGVCKVWSKKVKLVSTKVQLNSSFSVRERTQKLQIQSHYLAALRTCLIISCRSICCFPSAEPIQHLRHPEKLHCDSLRSKRNCTPKYLGLMSFKISKVTAKSSVYMSGHWYICLQQNPKSIRRGQAPGSCADGPSS